jgi:hypothetical protein
MNAATVHTRYTHYTRPSQTASGLNALTMCLLSAQQTGAFHDDEACSSQRASGAKCLTTVLLSA